MVHALERIFSLHSIRCGGRFARLLVLWLVIAALGVAMLLGLSGGPVLEKLGEGERSVKLRDAQFMELGRVDGGEPLSPPAAGPDRAVRLPHRLDPGGLRHVNYRIALEVPALPASARPWALCVPRWSSSATVWLNGQLLRVPAAGTAGLMDMHRPALMALPPQLRPGQHTLDIRLLAVPGAVSGLSAVWFGDDASMRARCQGLHESQRDSGVGNAYLMGFMGLVALAIGGLTRDRLALYFALLAAAWCTHHLLVLGSWTAMDEAAWLAAFYATRPLAALPLALFVLNYIGHQNPGVPRGLLLLYGVAYVAFAVLPPTHWPLWLAVFGLVLLSVMLVLFVWLVRYSVQKAAFSVVIFCVSLVLAIAFNLMDVGRGLGWLPWADQSFSYLTIPLLAFGMGALMLERLVRYMGAEERSAVELREEVARQRAKMGQDFVKLQEQAEKIAVLEERKRIVRDMHDGLGTQLVSASALLRSSPASSVPLTAVIDGALHELRSVLDVLSASPHQNDPDDDPDDDPVSLLLAKLRHRIGPVFRARGIEIVWQTESMPRGFLTNDQGRLQLLRVLQEAFSNVLKHSQARRVQLSTQVFNDRIVVELRDDGVGMDVQAPLANPLAGHGLANMHLRALDMDSTLKISRLAPGTSVRLTFPWSPR